MSRRHIYRGKPTQDYDIISQIWRSYYKDGFIYGSLFEKDNKAYICVSIQCKLNCYVNNAYVSLIEVIPETIGQYTGLTDKNGNKIFEGDIVKYNPYPNLPLDNYTSVEGIGLVKWYKKECAFCVSFYSNSYGGFDIDIAQECEVIGNIHDNPELLEVR